MATGTSGDTAFDAAEPPADGRYGLFSGPLLSSFPEPAVVATKGGRIVMANAPANVLAELMEEDAGAGLRQLVERCAEGSISLSERVLLRVEEDVLAYQVHLIPIAAGEADTQVLILARDLTGDRNLVDALVASRELFKDLVGCSSDFAWETDPNGRFTYVSRDGALGFGPNRLVGHRARDLLLENESPDHPFPFDARVEIEDVEIWLKTEAGSLAYCRVSSRPVFDEGTWIATRGVCRDITDEHEREAELERARMRERLLQRIVEALRTEVEPKRLLMAATTLPGQVLGATQAWVFRGGGPHPLSIAARHPERNTDEAADAVVQKLVREAVLADVDSLPMETRHGDLELLCDVTRFRGSANGAIVEARPVTDAGWGEEDRQLVGSVAAHLGIAFHQMTERERLEELSRKDEVTGLMNRRAFVEDLRQRMARDARHGHRAALLYVDLDNFKSTNDVLGHATGDELLRRVAAILSEDRRAADMVGRLGGDEFAVWLEETDADGAATRAKRLLERAESLAEMAKNGAVPVTMSIGIAPFDPKGADDVDSLMSRADEAMYEAKHGGKARFAVHTVRVREKSEAVTDV